MAFPTSLCDLVQHLHNSIVLIVLNQNKTAQLQISTNCCTNRLKAESIKQMVWSKWRGVRIKARRRTSQSELPKMVKARRALRREEKGEKDI